LTESKLTRRSAWVPPKRPNWVGRIIAEGSCLDLKSVVPLDEDSLLSTARRSTGLSDFGVGDWYEPFKQFIRSLDDEAQLHLIGRILARADVLMLLEARLRIEDTYKWHPQIEDEQIVKPLLIMGQGRTGTSVLQNMLSADPHNRPLKTWESMFPCPPPDSATYLRDPRIARAHAIATQWNRITPEVITVHEFSGDIPIESIHLQSLSFMTPGWQNLIGQVPSYNAYMANQNMEIAYRYERRALKLLQWKNRRGSWVLKTPVYILSMPEALKVYPDACFIWTHRDPVKALSSVVNTLGTLNWIRSDQPFIGGSFEQHTDATPAAMMMARPIDWLESGIVPRRQLCNIQYLDFVRDPLAAVATIYEQFQIPLTSEGRHAMQVYMAEAPRSQRPAHRYNTGASSQISAERQLFKRYQDYFNVPDEL
jgi:hypothetical protein